LDGRCAVPKIAWHLVSILLPVVAIFALLPAVYSNHLLLFNFIIFMTLAQGINVIYGFTGYLPFGYVGFFGAGAYGFSLMVLHLQAPPLLALAVAAAAAVALALLLTPLFRLSGAYFSIANLAAALAVLQVVSNPNLEELTKGPYGISLSGVFNPTLSYATALAILAATLALVIYLRNSHFGMALKAIREDPISAGMAGINVVRERIIAWVLSALIAGLAGGVFAWYVSVFYPETVFSVEFTIFAIVFALFGGNATVTGPILGVVILYGVYNAVGISTPQYCSCRTASSRCCNAGASMSPDRAPLLTVDGIVKRFGGFRALDGLNLAVRTGEILGLVGPNGSGKTTCINVISGLYRPDSGTIRFDGRSIGGLPSHRLVHAGINRTFQIPRPFLTLTVRQNVEIAAAYGRNGTGPADIGALLSSLDLAPFSGKPAGELNSAQQKMLDLARALATGPRLLLIDELAAGLNPAELERVAAKLKELAGSGIALLVVEHLMGFIDQITDRIIVMNAGKEIFEGRLAEAARDAQVVEVFLGEEHAA